MKKNDNVLTNKRTVKKKKHFASIYYYDGSGDNIPCIVDAMKNIDVKKRPSIVIGL